MDFGHRAGLGRIMCTDIGRYQLHGDLSHVQILNSTSSELWPAVRATPDDYDGFDDARAILSSLQASVFVHNAPAWVSQTSLRCWVNIQQQYLEMQRSGKWQDFEQKVSAGTLQDDEAEEEMYHFFWNVATQSARSRISNYPLLQTTVNALSKLKPGDGSALLDQASEFISTNVTGFFEGKFHLTARNSWDLRTIVWGESRDGKTKLEVMLEQQSSALSGGISNCFILDPSLDSNDPRNNLITRGTAKRWLEDGRLFMWPHGVSNTAELRQLTYLHMALSPFEILNPNVSTTTTLPNATSGLTAFSSVGSLLQHTAPRRSSKRRSHLPASKTAHHRDHGPGSPRSRRTRLQKFLRSFHQRNARPAQLV